MAIVMEMVLSNLVKDVSALNSTQAPIVEVNASLMRISESYVNKIHVDMFCRLM